MCNTVKLSVTSSKSYLQRALAIAALVKGVSFLENVRWCDDTLAAKKIIEDLGCIVTETKGQSLSIDSSNLNFDNTLFNAGESGLNIRMFSAILALSRKELIFTGKATLQTRPLASVLEGLSFLNVTIDTNKGLLPLKIKGPIQAGKIKIDASLSSQFLTGLLIVLPLLDGDSIIEVRNLKSRPYVDMTLDIMSRFGVTVNHNDYKIFTIKGKQRYKPITYCIEGDWSGGAFFLVWAAVKGKIKLENLSVDSQQADRIILDVLEDVGAKLTVKNKIIQIEKNKLKAFTFDASNSPDLFPPLVCLASQCKGESRIKGISRLVHKESNRAKVLQEEFSKIGIAIKLKNDDMFIRGGTLKAALFDSHNDHRIAMAGEIMNLFSEKNNIRVINKSAVNKSYPTFFEDLEKIKQYLNT